MLDPTKYHNHGDNPAMKKFLQIAMENAKGSKYIDHRTYFVDNGQRYFCNHFLDSSWQEIGMTSFKEI